MSIRTILLVQNMPDRERIYEAGFRARGYSVVVVHDAASVMRTAPALNPSCIVIDDRLDDTSGWDLCARVKSDSRLARIPIVVVAQRATRGAVDEGRRAHCNAWLTRPTRPDDLVRAVEQVLATGASAPASSDDAILGITECPACASENIRAGVSVGAVQYYCCRGCALCWRVELRGVQTA